MEDNKKQKSKVEIKIDHISPEEIAIKADGLSPWLCIDRKGVAEFTKHIEYCLLLLIEDGKLEVGQNQGRAVSLKTETICIDYEEYAISGMAEGEFIVTLEMEDGRILQAKKSCNYY